MQSMASGILSNLFTRNGLQQPLNLFPYVCVTFAFLFSLKFTYLYQKKNVYGYSSCLFQLYSLYPNRFYLKNRKKSLSYSSI